MGLRYLLGVAVAVALASGAHAADVDAVAPTKAAPLARSPVSSYLEIALGTTSESGAQTFPFGFSNDFSTRGWTFLGAGRVNMWMAPNVSTQFDVWGSSTSWGQSDFFGPAFNTTNFAMGGHVSVREPTSFLFGVFGAAGSTSPARYALVGLEGQVYLGNLTLYGQGGYESTLGHDGFVGTGFFPSHASAWFARGVVRYYPLPNWRFEGVVGYARPIIDFSPIFGFTNPSITDDFWEWRVKTEVMIPQSQVSVFLAYQGVQNRLDIPLGGGSGSEVIKATNHTFLIGARFYIGELTLLANDRTGTTLEINDVFSRLPAGASRPCFLILCVSDIRLKRDVTLLAHLDNGLGLYRYRYAWSDTSYVGVMAQEVAARFPDAVTQGPDGFLRVNYSSLGLRLVTWDDWVASEAGQPWRNH